MAGKASGLKGNPASKRMSNAALKAKRARSWARRQVRKAANLARAKDAFDKNEEYRKAGLPTPYEERRLKQRAEYEAHKSLKTG